MPASPPTLFADLLAAVGDASREQFAKLCPFPTLIEVHADAVVSEPRLAFDSTSDERRETFRVRTAALLPTLRQLTLHFLAPKEPGALVTVGRGDSVDVQLSGEGVSPTHVSVHRQGGRWRLTDLESRAGSFLEGHRLPAGIPLPVGGGQYLRLGRTNLLFVLTGQLYELLRLCRGDAADGRLFPPTGVNLGKILKQRPDLTSGPPILLEVPREGPLAAAGEQDLTRIMRESQILAPGKGRSSPKVKVFALRPRASARSAVVVGRRGTCDVVIEDGSVSKQHARLRSHRSMWQVLDLESANGTFVGQRRLPTGVWTHVPLGSTLSFGSCRFAFVSSDEFTRLLDHLANLGAKAKP